MSQKFNTNIHSNILFFPRTTQEKLCAISLRDIGTFFTLRSDIHNLRTTCTATAPRFFSELNGKTWITADFDLMSWKSIPICARWKDKSTKKGDEEILKSEADFSNNTLRPQERMAFSVGEPVISASPPSCTKEKHRCNCVKHGRLVIAIDKCYGWYFNSIPRLPPGGCLPVQVSNILRARTSNIRQPDCFRS